MNNFSALQDLLADPQAKAYFLQLLQWSLSDEEKYQRFQEFLAELAAGKKTPVPSSRAGTGEALSFPQGGDRETLAQTIDQAIRRSVRRMVRSQHRDGGWGPYVEQSSLWHTAHTILFLNTARELLGASVGREVEDLIRRGMLYLDYHPEGWAVEAIPTTASMSMCDVSLMVRCFYRAGRAHLRRESASRVYRGIDRIYHSQNDDGGWDARVWGYEVTQLTRVWSEVSGTNAALQAMAQTFNDRFKAVMEKGMRWLSSTQNPDGSWSDGSTGPYLPAYQLEGGSSLGKTCEAVQGLLCGQAVDLTLRPFQAHIDRAVDWICQQAVPVLTRQDPQTGLGGRYSAADYDTVCLALETLVQLPGHEHELTAPCAAWLLQTQRQQEGDSQDGSWVIGHTARIGLALAAYLRCIREETPPQRMPWVL